MSAKRWMYVLSEDAQIIVIKTQRFTGAMPPTAEITIPQTPLCFHFFSLLKGSSSTYIFKSFYINNSQDDFIQISVTTSIKGWLQ